MAQFTKEQAERLAKYEHTFNTAVHSGYLRGNLPREVKAEMVEVMEAATGLRYGDILLETCGSCVYRFVKDVGDLYYASLAAIEAETAAGAQNAAPAIPAPTKTKKALKVPKKAKK